MKFYNNLFEDKTIPEGFTVDAQGKAQFPGDVDSISRSAFIHCHLLKEAVIPDNVVSIGKYAFGWCKALTSVDISCRITKIKSGTFTHCSIFNVNIPGTVNCIEAFAFRNCYSLKKVVIPGSVSIGYKAFGGCINLDNITFVRSEGDDNNRAEAMMDAVMTQLFSSQSDQLYSLNWLTRQPHRLRRQFCMLLENSSLLREHVFRKINDSHNTEKHSIIAILRRARTNFPEWWCSANSTTMLNLEKIHPAMVIFSLHYGLSEKSDDVEFPNLTACLLFQLTPDRVTLDLISS